MVLSSHLHCGCWSFNHTHFVLPLNHLCLYNWWWSIHCRKGQFRNHYWTGCSGSLLGDYILTVAVSTSASTDAITSAFPVLHEHRVLIALFMIAIVTVLNLRGITESATILMYPVYLLVVAILVLIIGGGYQRKETVVSQIASTVFGRGIMYYSIQAVTALTLFLAANTAFAAFPLLAFMLAKDRFMPNMFMVRGDRLGFYRLC